MGKVSIVTSWCGGKAYSVEYVNRLYRACLRNMSREFDFILYAGLEAEKSRGDLDAAIEFVPVELLYWWGGMRFWQDPAPGIKTDARLFLDLDVVVVGNLDVLFDTASAFCCSRDWTAQNAPDGHVNDANPGVTLLRGNAGAWVWDEYERAGMPQWDPMDPEVDHSPCHMAAQGIINSGKYGQVDLFPTDLCASYKYTVKKHGLPPGCVTVHFHGHPKPHEVDEGWVKSCW